MIFYNDMVPFHIQTRCQFNFFDANQEQDDIMLQMGDQGVAYAQATGNTIHHAVYVSTEWFMWAPKIVLLCMR